nr:ORF99 [Acipenserid herpesvirus 1]
MAEAILEERVGCLRPLFPLSLQNIDRYLPNTVYREIRLISTCLVSYMRNPHTSFTPLKPEWMLSGNSWYYNVALYIVRHAGQLNGRRLFVIIGSCLNAMNHGWTSTLDYGRAITCTLGIQQSMDAINDNSLLNCYSCLRFVEGGIEKRSLTQLLMDLFKYQYIKENVTIMTNTHSLERHQLPKYNIESENMMSTIEVSLTEDGDSIVGRCVQRCLGVERTQLHRLNANQRSNNGSLERRNTSRSDRSRSLHNHTSRSDRSRSPHNRNEHRLTSREDIFDIVSSESSDDDDELISYIDLSLPSSGPGSQPEPRLELESEPEPRRRIFNVGLELFNERLQRLNDGADDQRDQIVPEAFMPGPESEPELESDSDSDSDSEEELNSGAPLTNSQIQLAEERKIVKYLKKNRENVIVECVECEEGEESEGQMKLEVKIKKGTPGPKPELDITNINIYPCFVCSERKPLLFLSCCAHVLCHSCCKKLKTCSFCRADFKTVTKRPIIF